MSEENIRNRKRFDVALSFPGDRRRFIQKVAEVLAQQLHQGQVFYDRWYEAELARPNLDVHLQSIYRDEAELIVVFLCAQYEEKEWCGLEWRAIRDLIKQKQDKAIMLIRFDNTVISGLLSIDSYVDVGKRSSIDIGELIIQRLYLNRQIASPPPPVPLDDAEIQAPSDAQKEAEQQAKREPIQREQQPASKLEHLLQGEQGQGDKLGQLLAQKEAREKADQALILRERRRQVEKQERQRQADVVKGQRQKAAPKRQIDQSLTRRQVLKWAVSAGVGVMGVTVARQLLAYQSSQLSPSSTPTPSPTTVDYSNLERFLKAGQWRDADQETANLMLEVSNLNNESWLDTTSIQPFPCEILSKIDRLWVDISGGKFGFSVQKKIYVENCSGNPDGRSDEKANQCFGDQVGWRVKGQWIEHSDIT